MIGSDRKFGTYTYGSPIDPVTAYFTGCLILSNRTNNRGILNLNKVFIDLFRDRVGWIFFRGEGGGE